MLFELSDGKKDKVHFAGALGIGPVVCLLLLLGIDPVVCCCKASALGKKKENLFCFESCRRICRRSGPLFRLSHSAFLYVLLVVSCGFVLKKTPFGRKKYFYCSYAFIFPAPASVQFGILPGFRLELLSFLPLVRL